MERESRDTQSTAGPPGRCHRGSEPYQPPQVAWEEEFAPLAYSGSGQYCDPGTDECYPGP